MRAACHHPRPHRLSRHAELAALCHRRCCDRRREGDFAFTDTYAAATESGAIRDTRIGWTAGLGGEYAVGNGWSVKAEYLYVDLGRTSVTSTNLAAYVPAISYPTNVYSHSVGLKSNIVRVGLNYKFGGP